MIRLSNKIKLILIIFNIVFSKSILAQDQIS